MATASMSKMAEIFWHERIWLPPNVTWNDLETMNVQNASYSSSSYLWYPIPAAFLVIIIRSLFTQYVCRPMGIGIKAYDITKYARKYLLLKY